MRNFCSVFKVETYAWIEEDILRKIVGKKENPEFESKNSELLQSLCGIYPNEIGEGIARGHCWAIQKYLFKG